MMTCIVSCSQKNWLTRNIFLCVQDEKGKPKNDAAGAAKAFLSGDLIVLNEYSED